MTRHHHREGVQGGSEKPYRLQCGLAILHVGAIVGLAEAEMRRRKTRGAKIAVMKWNHRNQSSNTSVIEPDAYGFETRREMSTQAFRIYRVGDDREMLE